MSTRGKTGRGVRAAAYVLLTVLLAAGCTPPYRKYSRDFLSSFDTLTTVTGYARSEDDFMEFADRVEEELLSLHRLFDIYKDYEGLNNIKTVNDNAGIAPVSVEPRLLELAELGIEWYGRTDGAVNIALGPVLSLWHDSREHALEFPSEAAPPDAALLSQAAGLCDISKVLVNREDGTLYLTEPGMRLDVGAIAKGYAAEWVAENIRDERVPSFIISAGGNVKIVGTPADGRETWTIGVRDPDGDGNADVLYLDGGSAVTSGDYQRYFMAGDVRYCHIIDPATLYPASKHRSVTVTGPDSGVADILSTALFIMDEQQGGELAEAYGYRAVWID